MSERERNQAEEQAPIRVATREQFDEAVAELVRTGQPIEAPSLEMLAAWPDRQFAKSRPARTWQGRRS